MNTADLISSYLNNEMTPDQERQFLLSVAASDQLRLALKSHVMLDRVILRQAQDTHVPHGIRSAILAEASTALTVPGGAGRGASGGGLGKRFPGASMTNGLVALGIAIGVFAGGYFTRTGMESVNDATPVTGVDQRESVSRPSLPGPTGSVVGADVGELPAAAVAGVGDLDGVVSSNATSAGGALAVRRDRSLGDADRSGPTRDVNRVDLRKSQVVRASDNPLNASTDVFKELKSSQIASPESTGSPSHGLQPIDNKTVNVEGTIHTSHGTNDGGGQKPANP